MPFCRKYIASVSNKQFELTKDDVSVAKETRQMHVEEITPSVIEPSFGIGRIMYSMLEHNFKQREGDDGMRQVGGSSYLS